MAIDRVSKNVYEIVMSQKERRYKWEKNKTGGVAILGNKTCQASVTKAPWYQYKTR